MDLKREQIKKIKADPTLSEQEKSKQIQELMMGKFSFIISNQISNESKTCTHYTKQCYKFYFPCCETWDPCKRCHGERNCSNKDNLQVSKITCSSCETPQDPHELCINPNCTIKFANSYCELCQIWTSKEITHCDKCGICRLGAKETLSHCDDCGICFTNSDSNLNHQCKLICKLIYAKKNSNYKDGICVICSDNTFNSQSESFPFDCGHFVHKNCFSQYTAQGNYKCPCCRKSIGDLSTQWDFIRSQIKLYPIPNDFFPIEISDEVDTVYGKFQINKIIDTINKTKLYSGEFVSWYTNSNKIKKVTATLNTQFIKKNIYKNIICNDCGKKSITTYHYYGLECTLCGSFNTQI